MSTLDITRIGFEADKRYTGTRMQQGRVLTDDDYNDNARIQARGDRLSHADIIGHYGSPDNGFAIENPTVNAQGIDFTILPGSLYVAGKRLELADAETYQLQKDWLQNPFASAPDANRYDLVYLECWEQDVSAVEDNELYEPGLGGPDTAQRTRMVTRIRIKTDAAPTCDQAWLDLMQDWQLSHKGNVVNHVVVPDTILTVGFEENGLPDDLCHPQATGGYLGAENQAIRVQLTDSDHFTWGYDNGAPLYRVQVDGDAVTVHVESDFKDHYSWPKAGQVVELIPWGAMLPNGEKCAQEGETGHLAKVESGYDPDQRTFKIVAADAVPADWGLVWQDRADAGQLETRRYGKAPETPFFYLRIWNRGPDITSPKAIPITSAPISLGTTGLTATFSGNHRPSGTFWVIGARPQTEDAVIPWKLLVGRPPHGFHRRIAPLGLIRWTVTGTTVSGTVVQDCRPRFRSLTDQKVCCSFTVGDGRRSFGDFDSIEGALRAMPQNTWGEICLLPGIHQARVVMENRQNITIHGCDKRTLVTPRASNLLAAVFTVHDCRNIVFEHMDLVSQDGSLFDLQSSDDTALSNVTIRHNRMLACIHAVRVRGGSDVDIVDNNIRMLDKETGDVAIFIRAEESRIAQNRIHMVPVIEEAPPTSDTPPGGGYDPHDPCLDPMLIDKPIFELYSYLEWAWADAFFAKPQSAYVASGGIQIGSTSERITITHNLILGGAGNGISLGHAPFQDGSENELKRIIEQDYAVKDLPTAHLKTLQNEFDSFLYDIRIEENEIRNMGKNGIGVFAFFNLENIGLMVTVDDLTIYRNRIEDCLLQIPSDTPPGTIPDMGYGGICLAGADNLTVRQNRIEHNGRSHLEPISGIFVMYGENVDISENRIAANGPRTSESDQDARFGIRAGIYVGMTFKKIASEIFEGAESLFLDAIPAVKVHDNVVVQPLGQALFILACGPLSVVGNHLTSQGVGYQTSLLSLISGTVIIMNLGMSKDVLGGWLLYSNLKNIGLATKPDHMQHAPFPTGTPATPAKVDLTASESTDDPLALALLTYIPSGNVLFANNRTTLDLRAPEFNGTISSQFFFTLDDMAYVGNQSECASAQGFDVVLSDVIALSVTIRASNNRFQEGYTFTLSSMISVSFLMNTTALNQATHCIIPLCALNTPLNPDNTTLYALDYCEDILESVADHFNIDNDLWPQLDSQK